MRLLLVTSDDWDWDTGFCPGSSSGHNGGSTVVFIAEAGDAVALVCAIGDAEYHPSHPVPSTHP